MKINWAFSQSQYIVLVGTPNNVQFILDEQKITKQGHYLITPGRHIIHCWAPNHQLKTDTILIVPSKTQIYKTRLKTTYEYNSYRVKLRNYYLAKYSATVMTGLWALYAPTKLIILNKKIAKYYEYTIRFENSYYNSFSGDEFFTARKGYVVNKFLYLQSIKKFNNTIASSAVILPIGIICSTILVKQFNRSKKPTYNEQVPILFSLNKRTFTFKSLTLCQNNISIIFNIQ